MGIVPRLTFDALCRDLPGLLEHPPGLEAQRRMAPVPRRGWRPDQVPEDGRAAAALLLLFPEGDDAALILTKRSSALPQHRGQVSLPGGAVDPGETLTAAALREAREEVGIDPGAVRVLGALTPVHIPVSGFVLHPMVGSLAGRPTLVPAPHEVSRVIEVPVRDLLDPLRHRRTIGARDGLVFDMPYFDVDGEQVWGATAMVLAEFAALLGVQVEPR